MTTRTDVINYFIKYRNYRTYLEIGVYDGINFMNVDCSEKIGIDPSFAKLHTSARPYCVRMNSDEFFNSILLISCLILSLLMVIIHTSKL